MRRMALAGIIAAVALSTAMMGYLASQARHPSIFLIGDSISEGYAPVVKRALPMAEVERQPVRCRHTGCLVQAVDKWIASRPRWTVVYFNSGYHDVRLRKGTASVVTPLDQYVIELKIIAAKLRSHSDAVIFATTTPIPGNPDGMSERSAIYNAAAISAMREIDIEVHDLNAVAERLGPQYRQSPTDAHFTADGYEALGISAAAVIMNRLR
jgi:hypothetical protein